VPVKFKLLPAASASQSSDSTPVESDKGKSKSEDDGVPICPACKSNLHNNRMMFRESMPSDIACRV
jgi:nitric oxide synthase-interacting protein